MVKKFSLFFSLTCLFKHKLGRAQQKSATRHVTFPSIVVSDVRMRAARCRSRNCLWTRTCSGWVMDQILFVFGIFFFFRFIMLFYAAGRVNCIHKLLEGQTKFTCNGYRPFFFFYYKISSQNKISGTRFAYLQRSLRLLVFFFSTRGGSSG